MSDIRVADWLKFHCGDAVYDAQDERFAGRVVAILHGAFVRIRWDDTQWLSDVPLRRVRRVTVQ